MIFPVIIFISGLTVLLGTGQVDIYYGIKNFTKIDNLNRITLVPHSIYRVKNIYIYPDFIPKDALEGGEAYLKSLDTTYYKGYYFISPKGKPDIKYDLIIQISLSETRICL